MGRPLDPTMPVPQLITRRFVLEQHTTFLDPAGSATPAISAETAWQTMTRNAMGGGRAQLKLGYLTSVAPKADHLLAWVLELHHVASDDTPGGVPPALGGVTGLTAPVTAPPPPCAFGGAYAVLDATTGRELWSWSGPDEFLDPPQDAPARPSP